MNDVTANNCRNARAGSYQHLVCLSLSELTERQFPLWHGFDPSHCKGKWSTCQIRSPCDNCIWNKKPSGMWQLVIWYKYKIVSVTDLVCGRFSAKRRLNSNGQQGVAPPPPSYPGHSIFLTLILPMWRLWWAPNNASKWQMEFNSALKGLSSFIYNFSLLETISTFMEVIEDDIREWDLMAMLYWACSRYVTV
jgi:hypothetical protein